MFMKILPQMYLWTGKNWLNFGSRPLLDHKDMKTGKLQQRFNDHAPFVYSGVETDLCRQ